MESILRESRPSLEICRCEEEMGDYIIVNDFIIGYRRG